MAEEKNWKAVIEGILFTMGRSVRISQIAAALGLAEEQVRTLAEEMMKEYEDSGRGIHMIELEDSLQLCTKAEYYEYLIRIAAQPKKHVMTDALLETLSIVAYKQPITKSEIERIRGVKSDHAINKLVEYDLIEEVGRMDAPGKPILFATTEEFLRSFGVSSLMDLPMADPEQIEVMKEEAEEEISVTL
ncbi:MAG: SMC-Scp complex subunit ScpB [Lachnospiraceae bacterium]|nr:SMC-Scp complex subunit ScpB [Candidatus Fimimorpha excrementavium]